MSYGPQYPPDKPLPKGLPHRVPLFEATEHSAERAWQFVPTSRVDDTSPHHLVELFLRPWDESSNEAHGPLSPVSAGEPDERI